MKIEKLTENKIRVIIRSEELGLNNLNTTNSIVRAIETQEIFLEILKRAEKEVDFYTDGCKLLIEAFSSVEDTFVFTITKYSPDSVKKKKLVAKKKNELITNQSIVSCFKDFDTFCDFCNFIKSLHKSYEQSLFKNCSLYLWKDSYYLIVKNALIQNNNIAFWYTTLCEFSKIISCSHHFMDKILEHGTPIIKKNAIEVGINFFAK